MNNSIKLENINPDTLSNIEVSYSIGHSRVTDYYEILVISYKGKYGFGSGGNNDAQYMYAKGEFGLNVYDPLGVVLNLTELEYEWGDMIDMVFNIGDNHYRELDFPLALVVGDKCKEALGTLFHGVESKESPTTREHVFDNFEEAWKYVEEKIEREKAHNVI